MIHFVVVIFSLRMHAQQVFSALLNTIACMCRRGASGCFPAGLRLAFVYSVRDSFGHGKCLPIIYRGLMCMCCVMMMIAFLTIKSSLVPLIEGLCAQIYFRFEISVVCSHLLLFFFVKEKTC